MTRLMEQVIERLRSIPDGQQDNLAEFVLHELSEDERWAASTQEHSTKLRGFIDSVLEDDTNGRCEPMDPEQL